MDGNIETCVFGYSSDKIKASNIHFDSDCLPYICYNLNDGLDKLAGYSESGIDESQFNQLKQAVIAKYPNIDFTLYPYTANGRYSFAGCILYVTLAI